MMHVCSVCVHMHADTCMQIHPHVSVSKHSVQHNAQQVAQQTHHRAHTSQRNTYQCGRTGGLSDLPSWLRADQHSQWPGRSTSLAQPTPRSHTPVRSTSDRSQMGIQGVSWSFVSTQGQPANGYMCMACCVNACVRSTDMDAVHAKQAPQQQAAEA